MPILPQIRIRRIIRLGIGDVTQPIAPALIKALHDAVDQMGNAETFHGYAPDLGYGFLREAIAAGDYASRGCEIDADEIFVTNSSKCDCGNIQEIFSEDAVIAVCDPVYPVYVDSNVMAGRTGEYDEKTGKWSRVIYMPCTAKNQFVPELPKETPDLIYLCVPCNPTGTTLTRDQLKVWVDYANRTGAVILYDAAYQAYIAEDTVPHSIFEIPGARTCAIEFRSFSKNAGFTGVRLGFTVIPKDLVRGGVTLHSLWARRHGTKFNGAPYIVQKAGEAVYSPEGRAQLKEQVAYYMRNAKVIYDGLKEAGMRGIRRCQRPLYLARGTRWNDVLGVLRLPFQNEAGVVGTPGSGFGPSGEGYFRLTAFGTYENTVEAVERIKNMPSLRK